MSDIRNEILNNLQQFGFSESEALVYYELTRRGPLTHLQLARITGISRTRIYRIVEQLRIRGTVAIKTDDDGTAVFANRYENLELGLLADVEKLENRRKAYNQLSPLLSDLAAEGRPQLNFSLRTYDGVTGFKQMLWNELNAKGELLVFGDGIIEDLVGSRSWSEKQRAMTVEKGYRIREIANKPVVPTKNKTFPSLITTRRIDASVLPLRHQIIMYNDTVSIYCWRDGQKTGLEIINHTYAQMMRAIFERYWEIAEKTKAS